MKKRKWSTLFSALAATFVVLLCCPAAQAGYIDNGDGTVTDTGTGLMWQKATAPGITSIVIFAFMFISRALLMTRWVATLMSITVGKIKISNLGTTKRQLPKKFNY